MLHNATNSLVDLLFHSVSSSLPQTGWLYDVTQSYDFLFYIFGGVLALSGLIFLLEPKLRRVEAAKAERLVDGTGSRDNENNTDANENAPSTM